MPELDQELVRAWGISPPWSAVVPDSGTMNDTWLLEWAGGRAVLRRHRHRDRALVDWEHSVLAHANSAGIPCPSIIPTADDEPFLEKSGWFYSLYSWAPGVQPVRGRRLDPERARSMGSMLARIHLALGDMVGAPEAEDPLPTVGFTLQRIGELIAIARGRPDAAQIDWVVGNLTARAGWLRNLALPPPAEKGPGQVIHGDYLDGNVFFRQSDVSCVIDWDKARRELPAREIVRAMDHSFGVDPVLCQSFLRGYRGTAVLPTEELERAANWFSYQQAHSLWVFEQLLVDRNDRVVRLVRPESFRPFAKLWQSAALT